MKRFLKEGVKRKTLYLGWRPIVLFALPKTYHQGIHQNHRNNLFKKAYENLKQIINAKIYRYFYDKEKCLSLNEFKLLFVILTFLYFKYLFVIINATTIIFVAFVSKNVDLDLLL